MFGLRFFREISNFDKTIFCRPEDGRSRNEWRVYNEFFKNEGRMHGVIVRYTILFKNFEKAMEKLSESEVKTTQIYLNQNISTNPTDCSIMYVIISHWPTGLRSDLRAIRDAN